MNICNRGAPALTSLARGGGLLIKHLILVAGPQAAGKSTFMGQLASGRLPEELMGHIPAGAANWVHTDAKRFLDRTPETHSAAGLPKALPGLVFHYSLIRRGRLDIESFAGDPALEILRLADEVLIISIVPPPARLVRQFAERALEEQAQKSKRPLRRLQRLITGEGFSPMTTRQSRVFELYQSAGWLERLYRDWEAYVETCRHTKKNVQAIRVEPYSGSGQEPSFHLLEAVRDPLPA
jgi:hypothetical protein